MLPNRLYKKEKLCSSIAIDQLFGKAAEHNSALTFPLRAVWRENARRSSDAPLQFLISVPKKRLRHAVDRVKMRRRIREAYRLSDKGGALPQGTKIDVAFIYVASDLQPYGKVKRAVERLLSAIKEKANEKSVFVDQ